MAQNRPIDVELGEWKYAGRGAILRATTVSTGVAVALSNPHTGRGYLGFFTADSVLQFRGMVRTVLAQSASPRDVLMWFSGAAYIPASHAAASEINAEALSLRQHIAGRLNRTG
ncbi:MAG TPA: hypothetical protein VJM46_04830, partial [Candidatus Saccharimonadales bacterium]|nr:hypothetical protein [Candidatus Saccharimonadales bacterium]